MTEAPLIWVMMGATVWMREWKLNLQRNMSQQLSGLGEYVDVDGCEPCLWRPNDGYNRAELDMPLRSVIRG